MTLIGVPTIGASKSEVNQSSGRGAEPAGIDLERRQWRLEVDEQPLLPGCLCFSDRVAHHRGAETLSLVSGPNLRVDKEGMITAVPRDIDEPDKLAGFGSGCHPSQRVFSHAIPPPRLRRTAVGLSEFDELAIRHRCSPLDLHVSVRHHARLRR